jgi:hypothetical protein
VPQRQIPWAGDDPAPESASVDAVRGTLSLVGELSEALAAQIRRARELLAEQPVSTILPASVGSLERHATAIREGVSELDAALPGPPRRRKTDSPVRVEGVARDVTEARRAREAGNGKAEPETEASDSTRMVVLDLKLLGCTREQAEQVMRNLGIEDAESLVEDMFTNAEGTRPAGLVRRAIKR